MKKTKRFLSIPALAAVTGIAAFSLAACGGSSDNTQSTTQEASASAATTENTSAAETTAATDTSSEAQADADFGVFTEIAGENGTDYESLFEVILSPEYDDYWVQKTGEIVGEDDAETVAAMLKDSISREIYGDEATQAYADAPETIGFDCFYINDAQSFEFKDDEITVTLNDGSKSTYTYEYLGKYTIGEGESMTYNGESVEFSFDVDAYKSTEDAGEFTYFLMCEDTMDTTYHLEFRYGSDLTELQKYFEGKYAYWLAAGFDKNADEETTHNVIDLFITENLAGEE